jgi:hypothetical protein
MGLNRTQINNNRLFVIPAFYIIISSIESIICKCIGRYDDGWLGRFYQKVDV